MTIAHLLEDFATVSADGRVHVLNDDTLEEHRLAAFEQGYGAGWEDAVQAQEQSRTHVSAELGQALQDMSFTHHEALSRMTLSLEPMFQSLVRVVLPESIEKGLGTRVIDQLCSMAREQIGQPIQILVPEGQSEAVQSLIPYEISPPPSVIEDPSLEAGQARLQVGMSRREIDCSALLASITGAFESYVFEANEALANE